MVLLFELLININVSAAVLKTSTCKPRNSFFALSPEATNPALYKTLYDLLPSMKPKTKLSPSELKREMNKRVFIHLDFHPFEPN